jgi:hypothetical protein
MIGDIVAQLQQARMPEPAAVKQWLKIALIKKMGVISLPYHFWHFATVEGIIHTEYINANKDPELADGRSGNTSLVTRTVTGYVEELLALAPEPVFRKLLADKANKILPQANYPETT